MEVWTGRLIVAIAVLLVCYAVIHTVGMLIGSQRRRVSRRSWRARERPSLRVAVALLIGSLWTIPAGVAIGFSPKLARIAQPLAQIAASVPATALFPIVLLVLIRLGGGLGMGSIAAAAAGNAVVHPLQRHRRRDGDSHRPERSFGAVQVSAAGSDGGKLILPGIFPYLVTGLVTASGGAWNARSWPNTSG